MRSALVLVALTATLLTPGEVGASPGVTTQRPPHRTVLVGEGFDICQTPSTGVMRSWTDSHYRAANIYIGGIGRAEKCLRRPELSKQWVRTVTANGWALIPTYVGRQPPCRYNTDKPHFTYANARDRGREAAVDAVTIMKTLGMPAGNPVYVDIEPFHLEKSRCTTAAVRFVSAWVRAMHHRHYRAGLYAHATLGLVPLRTRSHPKPDDIWWARWNNLDTTSDPAVGGSYRGHRIHQYRAYANDGRLYRESHHGQRLQIDVDAIHADVVGKVRPAVPTGAPYLYAASPPFGLALKARVSPRKDATWTAQYPTGTPLSIVCQTRGDNVFGSRVWDQLSDGTYVSDLYTTTTGRLSFTEGIPRC
jgi:hypothetical protein